MFMANARLTELATQHPKLLTVACEFSIAFPGAGMVHSRFCFCSGTGRRPARLMELLAKVEELMPTVNVMSFQRERLNSGGWRLALGYTIRVVANGVVINDRADRHFGGPVGQDHEEAVALALIELEKRR